MSESFIEPESLNSTLVSLDAILDDDGAVRLLNKELSSYNFDGVIPTTASTILVNELQVGMSFLPIGETEGALRTVVKVEFDDPEMTNSPSNDYIISYLSPSGDIQSVTYDGSQNIEVYFEDWEDKVLGTKGWLITQEGNAIFSNVAVRGRIEATEGLIDGDLIVTGSLSTSETADTTGGIVFDSDGIFAYDTDGNNTFLLDAATGDITIFGTPGDDLLTGEDVSDGGTTTISANRITTGSVTGRVFRSNSTMTPTSGTGIYLDGDGKVRFSDPDATFTFDSNGLNVTSTNATMTFNSTGLSISGAGVSIGGTVQIDGSNASSLLTGTDVGPSGTTTISGDRITTGSIESSAPDFIWNGITTFSTQGTRFSVNDGQIISEQFRIDSAGNAEFGGTLVAADGTFSGTLSAVDGTFTGTLSGVDGTFEGSLSAGVSIDSPSISGGTITGGTFVSRSINGQTIGVGQSVSGWAYNAIAFNSGGSTIWRQALTTSGDILFSRVDGTSSNYVSVNGRVEVTGANGRFEGSGAGLFGTATNLICKNINDYTINQNLGTNSAVEHANLNLNSMTAGQGTHYVHWTSTAGGAVNQYRLSRTTSTSLASSRNIKSFIESIYIDDSLLNYDFTTVKFKYNTDVEEFGDNAEYRIGIIAEEMAEIPTVRELVQYNEEGNPVGFDYQKLSLILMPIVKKQKERIDSLEERLSKLEEMILNG